MRTSPLWLLALFPWVAAPPAHAPAAPEMPFRCALAIEVHLEAPLAIGTLELSVIAGEDAPAWTPSDLAFCLGSSPNGCNRLEVRVRVLAPDDTPPGGARTGIFAWISN